MAIMQPYFFPYLGYYSLLEYADRFMILDVVQYRRKSWMNRNRILSPNGSWQYINAGVMKPDFGALIKDVKVDPDAPWRKRLIGQIEHYKTFAPYYAQAKALVMGVLEEPVNRLVDLNRRSIEVMMDYIGISCELVVYSESSDDVQEAVKAPGDWALEIADSQGASEYVNPPGGKDLFCREDFRNRGIGWTILTNNLSEYDQHRQFFEPGLSIIDVIMFNTPEQTRKLVRDFVVASDHSPSDDASSVR